MNKNRNRDRNRNWDANVGQFIITKEKSVQRESSSKADTLHSFVLSLTDQLRPFVFPGS